MKIGILLSRVRVEEKWLFEALDKRGVAYDRIDDREAIFDIDQPEPWIQYDAVLERSIGRRARPVRHSDSQCLGHPHGQSIGCRRDLR